MAWMRRRRPCLRMQSLRLERTNADGLVDRKLQIASFNGSFVPLARPAEAPVLPWYRDQAYFLGGWLQPSIWKSAASRIISFTITCLAHTPGQFIEGVATACLLGAYIGISNTVLVSLFIYATAPASGGHINPMITFSAVLAGICPLPRGGCFLDPSEISQGQAFLNEFVASFILLYLAYGVGLDPRQAVLFGPRLGPLLVGASLGLVTFGTSGIAPGYAGAQMNPARCFAYGIARRNLSDQWIWWFGPAAAALLMAAMYLAVPPNHALKDAEKQSNRAISAAQQSAA
ncbi:Aquaporin PIP2-7 [Tolypocladium capitatum]|uniref:Aquaporin PIP2-7 n=1 Tax=Tolypocladium capitatum TaxID=45235 RepID=A0A2K3QI35_9HYPO|nr:Aquaporin PIP2-7 [Tolypocladium capitatum]